MDAIKKGDTVMVNWAGDEEYRDGPYRIEETVRDCDVTIDIEVGSLSVTVPMVWCEATGTREKESTK